MYVFEGTAALNGVDTINNFNQTGAATDDMLSVYAFLGGGGSGPQAVNFTVGLDLTGAATVGVVYNKASLAATDIAVTAAAGKIAVEDNSKAVVLASADTDGYADATVNAYDVYYVEDTDTGTGQTYAVTKVATLNSSAAELMAFALDTTSFITGTASADVIVGTDGEDIIDGLALGDTITGGAGNDTLTGGTGSDTFVFSGVTAPTNGLDAIADFVVLDDTLQFSLTAVNAAIAPAAALAAGAVAAGNIVIAAGAVPADAHDYFLYNTATGVLSFDFDGTGAGAAVVLVTLAGSPVLTTADIVLV